MSRFTPLFLFLGIAAAVYLPQSGERPESAGVGTETTSAAETAMEGSVKERSAELAEPVEPEPVNVATSPDTVDEPLNVSVAPDISSAASVPGDNALADMKDPAAADVEDADPDAVIADAEQSEAGHISSAANADEIGSALRELSVFDLKTSSQEHLARLGCYDARIDGIWGKQSRASLQAFNKRVDGNWTEPSVELIEALRVAPASLCERDCVADASGGACIFANKPPVPEEAAKGDSGRSYLPPWMRGKELASTDPDAPADLAGPSSGATDIAEPRKQAVQRSYRRRVVERRWERERRRTYRRNDDWAPKGWPGQ